MKAVITWCRVREFPWDDVSNHNLGWDIEANSGELLRIEAKGTSSPLGRISVQLTPNEYAMMAKHRKSYRIATVSVGKREPHSLLMFAWNRKKRAWIAGGGRYRLQVRPLTGATANVVT